MNQLGINPVAEATGLPSYPISQPGSPLASARGTSQRGEEWNVK